MNTLNKIRNWTNDLGEVSKRTGKYVSALALGVAFLASTQSNAQCPTTNVIGDPAQFQWEYHPVGPNNPEPYYSGVMEVGEATITLSNGETLITRAYRQEGQAYSIPGPTLNMTPGNKYVLSLHNRLPYVPLDPAHNVYKDANAVNIHTHGLHISGESPADDVTRKFEGGRGGDFIYDIPADHMGGTFWYHAHVHGATLLQVSGGMFGMIVIDDGADNIPATVAAMEERQLMLGKLDPGVAGTSSDNDNSTDDEIMGGTLSSTTWTVNGVVGGTLCMPPNTWQHFRVSVADAGAMLREVGFGPECEVKILARDGVWRTVAPLDLADGTVNITGASRADFAVRTSSNSTITMNGMTIGTINVEGTADTYPSPFDANGQTWSADRPSYLRDLRGETNVNNESVSMGARTVNGSKFSKLSPTFQLPTNQVQEWSISGNVRHPFHLHVYHVQALNSDRDFEAGEYYDVVASSMSVRFDLNDQTTTPFSGRTIMHCHILAHEDLGAMGWLDVQGGQGPPTFPVDSNGVDKGSDYYFLDGGTGPMPPAAPSGLSANATGTSSIDLSWTDNASDEDGFNVERSEDGLNYSVVAALGADVTSYTDNGLASATTYSYRVTAFNTAGSSAESNTATATTDDDPVGGGPEMHVSNLFVVRVAQNGNRFRGNATITIVDEFGSPVSGATVSGDFSGTSSTSASGTTDASGNVTVQSGAVRNPSGEWCFTVTNVSIAGGTYNSAANVETSDCESSGSSIMMNNNLATSFGPASAKKAAANSLNLESFKFVGVAPNPVRGKSNVIFQLPRETDVAIEVYNVLGEQVQVIANKKLNPGQYTLEWNSTQLTKGTYIVKITAGNEVKTQRVNIMK